MIKTDNELATLCKELHELCKNRTCNKTDDGYYVFTVNSNFGNKRKLWEQLDLFNSKYDSTSDWLKHAESVIINKISIPNDLILKSLKTEKNTVEVYGFILCAIMSCEEDGIYDDKFYVFYKPDTNYEK